MVAQVTETLGGESGAMTYGPIYPVRSNFTLACRLPDSVGNPVGLPRISGHSKRRSTGGIPLRTVRRSGQCEDPRSQLRVQR
jgi:hypothetical protein